MNKDASHPGKPGLRMKELVRETGVPKSTILYYLSNGLLPEPIKTSPNMSYYPSECIDRIKFIQLAQRRHRLTLAEIKGLIDARGKNGDFSIHLKLKELVFGAEDREDLMDRKEFCRTSGLTDRQVRELLEARLLLPIDNGWFDREDVAMGKLLAQGFSHGLRIDDLTYYVRLGEQIVDHEMELRRRLTHHLPYDEDAALTTEMVKNARTSRTYIIDRLFQRRVAAMRDLKQEDPQ